MPVGHVAPKLRWHMNWRLSETTEYFQIIFDPSPHNHAYYPSRSTRKLGPEAKANGRLTHDYTSAGRGRAICRSWHTRPVNDV